MTSDGDRELTRLAALHVSAARACLKHFRSVPTFETQANLQRKFHVTYPIVSHAMNQVDAALILRDQGFEYVSRANVRVAYEHALVAQALVNTYDGEEPLIGSMS
jgi:hypothetical protein